MKALMELLVSVRLARRAVRSLQPSIRVVLLGVILVAAMGGASADEGEQPRVIRDVERSAPATPYIFDGDVRDLPRPRTWRPGDPIKEIPMRNYLPPGAAPLVGGEPGRDPLIDFQQAVSDQDTVSANEFTTPSRSFAGQGYTGVNPPDTVGDIGPDHYIQMINAGTGAKVRIWDKAEPSPTELSSFSLDGLGSGACGSGYGDPIVLYDRTAERWVLTEFASSGNHLCVYVSQTSDPISGGWYAYDFATPTFPDYPKYAVWATDLNGGDGSYVVTANDGGPGVYALDRGAMLVGDPATFQKLTMPSLPGFGIQGPAPADPDGPDAPPSGSPAIVMRHRDTELHSGPSAPGDVLEMWLFDVDWQNHANTTLTQAANIDVSEFDSTVCGTSFIGCFPQPGSSTSLMPIREVIMNRLQYYNHLEFETVVGNFVVDATGTNQGGIRWFEVRRYPGGDWALQQEGTYAPDSENRWMGSIAIDQSANLALAYNVTSSTTYPSLRYTGRSVDDTPGAMTQPEASIHEGSGANSSIRYGDYAAMGLDPEDDCTFWFTGMDNASGNWRTQIASFRFDLCGCMLPPQPPVIDATVGGENQVDLFWEDSELDTVVQYLVKRSRVPGGPYELVGTVADTSPGVGGGPGYLFEDTFVSGGIEYFYVVVADDTDLCRSKLTNEVAITATGVCMLRPLFDGLSGATSAVYDTCTVELDWSAGAAECGGPVFYNIYRSTTSGFTPAPDNLLAAGVPGTSARDVNTLTDDTDYYYLVRAVDLANGVEDWNTKEIAVTTHGPNTGMNTFFFEDFEAASSFDAWTVGTGPGPHRCGDWERTNISTQRPSGGSGYYARSLSDACTTLLPQTSTYVDSPGVNFAQYTGVQWVTLEFDIYYAYLDGGDDATMEVWDGSAWHVLWADSNTNINGHLTFDVTAYAVGNPGFRVRFNYQNANSDRWYSVDNVKLTGMVENACFAGATPPSVPDGSGGKSPFHADRLTVSGDSIHLSWDSSCAAAGYNLLYGDLADVAGATPSGGVCDLGAAGAFDWSSVPGGDLFFLLVGTDGAVTESSWGVSDVGERHGLTASGQCGVTEKNVTYVCQ